MIRRRFGVLLGALLVACGSSSSNGAAPSNGGDDAGDEMLSADDSTPDDTNDEVAQVETSDYPPGPYGLKAGDVMPDVTLQGYTDFDPSALANTAPYRVTSLNDLRHATTAQYGMLHVAEFW